MRKSRPLSGLAVFALGAALTAPAQAQTPEQIATAYLKDRNAELVSGMSKSIVAPPVDAVAPELAARELGVKEQLRDRRQELAATGERYTRATTTTRVLNVMRTGQRLILRLEEETRLEYERVDGTEPPYTAFAVPRDFSFVRGASGGWVLRDVRLVQRDAIAPINEVIPAPTGRSASEAAASAKPVSAPSVAGADPADPPKPQTPANSRAGGYNYSAMANYATRYWQHYNGDYRSMSQDCTNFISQAMRAGGWTEVTGFYRSNSAWWYTGWPPIQSYTWGGAENWYWFATGRTRTYVLSSVWSMGLADVLQLDFDRDNRLDHTMIVTRTGSGQRYLTYWPDPGGSVRPL